MTAAASFSLRDALDLEEAPPSVQTAREERADAEAAVAELMQDAQKEGEEPDDNDDDDDAPTASVSTSTSQAAAFAASANKPVKIDQSPATSPERTNDLRPSEDRSAAPPSPKPAVRSPNHYGKKSGTIPSRTRKRVPVLRGTLFFNEDWDDAADRTVRRSVLSGNWRYNDEPPEKQADIHTFEMISKDAHPSSSSLDPQNGFYKSSFGLRYPHVTPKGKRSTKTTTIIDKDVKLEFRKLTEGLYRIQGFGTNSLGGDFVLNGKAKPTTEGGGGYTIEIRKSYRADAPPGGRTPLRPTASAANARSTGGSSLLGSQRESLYARPSPATSISAPAKPVRTPDPRPERPEAAAEPADPPRAPSPARPSSPPLRKRPERRDIPTRTTPSREPATPILSQSQPMLSQSQLSSTPGGVDRVNGKGMWHAWTRSFDTPLLALLDLFDNAVDASWTLLPERPNHDNADYEKPKIRVDLDSIGRNGVVIRNSSRFIPPLQQVLQVYKSSKAGEGDNSIGENGIGVKHACASLSGLSFVFTKTISAEGKCTMSVGILMQGLQRDDGIVLPSVAFDLDDDGTAGSLEDVQRRLEEHCADFPETWGMAVREYGDDHFGDGIDRCLQHMDALRTHRDWKDSDHVFAVVLANLKHAAFDTDADAPGSSDDVIVIDGDYSNPDRRQTTRSGVHGGAAAANGAAYHTVRAGGDSDVDEDKQRSLSLLKTLRVQLPYLYLHLHDLDICVEDQTIESIYWERRLAELSRFELQLSQMELWSKVSKQRYSPDDRMSVFKITNPEETVRFFCGFDPYRCKNKYGASTEGSDDEQNFAMSMVPGGTGISSVGNNTAIKIYLYSRQSGRLIKVQNDPRNELGLTAGSTDFCQGMTVIIDDHNGTLPLNPTKQDTAYGHSKHGQIHAANLKEWTAAIAHFYWHYHYARFGNSKVAVTQAVANTQTSLEEVYKNYRSKKDRADGGYDDRYPTITPLCQGTFINYKTIGFSLVSYHNNPKIRAGKHVRESVVPIVNQQEVSRLEVSAAALQAASARKRRRTTAATQDDAEVSRHVSSLEVASAVPKRLRSAHQEEMEKQDRMVLGDVGPPPPPHQLQKDGGSLSTENLALKQELQRCYNQNMQIRENLNRASNQVMTLQNQCQNLSQANAANLRKLNVMHMHNKQLEELAKKNESEAARWKAEADRLRAASGGKEPPPAGGVVDLSDESDPAEVEKLRREVKVYKSRADFYQRETTAKKRQIEGLVEEKTRFEDRVQELEAAQLTVDAQDGDLLHF